MGALLWLWTSKVSLYWSCYTVGGSLYTTQNDSHTTMWLTFQCDFPSPSGCRQVYRTVYYSSNHYSFSTFVGVTMIYKKASSMCLLLIAVLYSSNAAPPGSCMYNTFCWRYISITLTTADCKKVPCYINPCHFASCPAIDSEDVTCVADHCGGCFAQWFLNGKEVTDQCGGMHMYTLAIEWL